MRTQCPKIRFQSEATHCLLINDNVIYNIFVGPNVCITDTMKALNAVILYMLIQFPTVAIPVNVYMYKELSAIK